MPLPRSLGRTIGRLLNPLVIRRGWLPVLVHVGRSSGKTYRTPLAVFPFDGGYAFTINYGPQSDWPKNVMSAGSARLEEKGAVIDLTDPRLLPVEEARALFPPDAKLPPKLFVDECVVMSIDESGQDEAP